MINANCPLHLHLTQKHLGLPNRHTGLRSSQEKAQHMIQPSWKTKYFVASTISNIAREKTESMLHSDLATSYYICANGHKHRTVDVV